MQAEADDTGMNDTGQAADDTAAERDRRRSRRNATLMTGQVYQRGAQVGCIVSNLSASGAKLLLPGAAADMLPDPAPGANITLTLPRIGDFPARLVWVQATGLGIDFLLPPEDVAGLLAAFFDLTKTS